MVELGLGLSLEVLVEKFDPYFLRDYDEAQQEFSTVREASSKAFG